MENKKTNISIDDIYKALKYHDNEILKHFNDESLSDEMYLFYAINSDIISNALSLVINMQTGNIDSVGVDNCCRTIIEAFVVLKMIAVGDVSKEQAKIFRYHYSVVDLANIRGLVNDEVKEQNDYEQIIKDREKAYEAMKAFYNCPLSKIKNCQDFDSSNFYLKKTLKDRIDFSTLLEKYPVCCNNIKLIYDYFSIFVHPRFEKDPTYEDGFKKIRAEYIGVILNYVINYLVENKLFVFDKEVTSFKEDFFERPELKNNVANIGDTFALFNSLESKICIFDEGFDSFSFAFLEQMKRLIMDMQISITLGYKEHIISIFKSAIEYISLYSNINTLELDDFKKVKLAHCYSSRLQINNLLIDDATLTRAGLTSTYIDDATEGLHILFKDYYSKKYNESRFDSFLKNIRANSLYFLTNNEKSYSPLIKELLENLYTNEDERKFISMMYRISKDMNHGGGYAFNASPGLIDIQCRYVQDTIYRYLIKYLGFVANTFMEHGIDIDLRKELLFFSTLSSIEQQEIEKIKNDYFAK